MRNLVIKIGSSIITNENGLDEQWLNQLSRDVLSIKAAGYRPVIVSSGAVAAGRIKLGIANRIRDITMKQAAAAIGQSSLMWAYERVFGVYDVKVAQILLTSDVFSDRRRYINTRNTVTALLNLD
ncbi:glutamate 5-kinase, partial [Candidatus Magnetoovum chiemensis]